MINIEILSYGQIKDRKSHSIDINGKEILAYNGYYHCFTAAYCRLTCLPMLSAGEYIKYVNKWLSATRCKKIHKPVEDNEKPVAFYLTYNGYCALYER